MSDLFSDVAADLGIDSPAPPPTAPDDLRGRVEDMTVQMGRLDTRMTEALLEADRAGCEVGTLRKDMTTAIADVAESVEGLTKAAGVTGAEVENAQAAIAALESAASSQEARIALLEAKMNRVGEVMSEQAATMKRLRARRVTVTHVILAIIAIAGCFNAFTEFAAKLDHEGRLRRIESAQVENW